MLTIKAIVIIEIITCQVVNMNCTQLGVLEGNPIPNSAKPKNLAPLLKTPISPVKKPPLSISVLPSKSELLYCAVVL